MKRTQHLDQARSHTGSSFDDFLDEEGIRNEVEGAAIKNVLAWQFEQEMLKRQRAKPALGQAR